MVRVPCQRHVQKQLFTVILVINNWPKIEEARISVVTDGTIAAGR
jgi:hypothetical protein